LAQVFLPLLPDSVDKGIMFSSCLSTVSVRPSVRLFVQTDLVTLVSRAARTISMKLTGNIY